jgi:hypothetical protein
MVLHKTTFAATTVGTWPTAAREEATVTEEAEAETRRGNLLERMEVTRKMVA